MKIEKLFLGLFASAMLVGCSQDDALTSGNEEQGNAKDSYIAVKINSPYDLNSRADDSDFADAEGNEGDVTNAHFFFFNDNGDAVAVDGSKNYKEIAVNETADSDNDGHTESLVDAVVVLEKPKTIPTKMVAILNWTYDGAALNLDALTQTLATEAVAIKQTAGFVMSNSVYYDNGIVNATKVTSANFASTPDLAKQHSVEVYVERLAAKVKASLKTAENTDYNSTINAYDTGVTYKGANDTDVKIYAQVLGWQINTTNPQSYLVKQLDATWGTNAPFTLWNEPARYRSYWGNAYQSTDYENKSFKWEEITAGFNHVAYCLENTSATTTKAVFKAQLGIEESGAFKPLTIWQWYSKYYLTLDAMMADVVGNINGQVDKLNTTFADVKAEEVELVYASSTTAAKDFYKVTFKLKDGVNDAVVSGETKLSDIIAATVAAKKWQDGATYYFTNVDHLGYKDAIIRNHAYELQVTKVVGLGTPANKPDEDDQTPDPDPEIPEPVDPSDTETYIAAKINVLSWRLWNYDVTLGN